VLGGIAASNPSPEGSGPVEKHCEVVIMIGGSDVLVISDSHPHLAFVMPTFAVL
jgi:hypothetical protein